MIEHIKNLFPNGFDTYSTLITIIAINMVIFSILFYFLAGFLLSCLYNLFNLIPPPCDMTEDQKRIMFLIVLA